MRKLSADEALDLMLRYDDATPVKRKPKPHARPVDEHPFKVPTDRDSPMLRYELDRRGLI